MPWPKVQRRLAQLIQEERFYTEEEQDRFDNIDPIAIREALEERGIVNGQVADPEKLDNDPFIQQVRSDAEQIADAETEQTSEVSISDEEYDAVRRPIPQRTSYDPAAPVYAVGDTVYIEDDAYQITELREDTVQLLPTGMVYPIYRAERKEQFEQLLRADRRNAYYTEFLPIDPDKAEQDLRDVLAHGLMDEADKKQISTLLQSGRSNSEIAYWLSRAYSGEIETLNLETGDIVDYRTTAQGIELEVMDAEEKRLAMLYFRWDEVAPLLRGMYARQQDGFGQEQPQPATESPTFHSETMAVYPGDKNNLPYDVVVERLHIEEPEPPAPVTEPEKTFEEVLDEHPVSIQVNGQWQTFPNAKAAEEASYEEYKANLRRNAKNFRITDEHLGEGGPKAKFQANVNAIRLLKELEAAGQQASPEQQEVLSRYVGWGGLSDAFDPEKPAWALEYAQLKELLTPEEYAAARGSTLNAHYTSPTVIRAIYETVGRMGFETGNILEPSCGVGNFFGMLPEEMRNSRLYGVELDSISGRIAKQLYPKADITVAGFETTDRRDFYDLAIGNVPFGQYQVRDKAYDKLNFSIHNYFFAKALDQVRPGGVVAFVTSRYTMDAKDSTVRRYLAQRAELLGAIRLPNNAFRANAGTDVVSDILFLQKRDRPLDIAPDWTQTGRTEEGFTVNQYFLDHPEMVLGRPTAESTQYGKQDYTVVPIEGLELADQLHDAVKYIHGTYQEAALPELGEGEDIDEDELRDISGRARFLIRKLGSNGWFEKERGTDFREYITVPGHSSRLLELFHALREDTPARGYSYVFGTYSTLKVAHESDSVYDKMAAVYGAYDNTRALINLLQMVYHNVKHYFQMQIDMHNVGEVLASHFDDFGQKVMEAYIRPLKIKDSVPKYRVPIQNVLTDWAENDELLIAMANAALADRRGDTPENCRADLLRKIYWIQECYDNLERDYLDEIDAQVRRYTRAATQKIENLTNRDQNIRGNLHTVLTALSRNRRAADLVDTIQPVFRLCEQTYLSESSLWYRKRPGKRTKAAPVLVQETEADTAAAAKAAALLRSEYGRGAVAAYVQGWLGESDVCRSEDIPLKNDKDYVMSLLAVLTGGDRSADFTVQELDGERRENGYAIPELQISRKENNE